MHAQSSAVYVPSLFNWENENWTTVEEQLTPFNRLADGFYTRLALARVNPRTTVAANLNATQYPKGKGWNLKNARTRESERMWNVYKIISHIRMYAHFHMDAPTRVHDPLSLKNLK